LNGPFHRSELPLNAINNAHAGTLWGNPPRYGGTTSPFPKAQALDGPLPEGMNGLEFYTSVKPDTPALGPNGLVEWIGPYGDDVTSIPIKPTKIQHDGAVINFP